MSRGKKIAVIALQDGNNSQYWKYIENGVEAARRQFDVDLEYHMPPVTGERSVAAWQARAAEEIAGNPEILAAGVAFADPVAGARSLDAIVSAGIPCVTFDTDVPRSRRSFFIGANNFVAGQTCAYVLAKHVNFAGKIVIDSPSYTIQSCLDRVSGFMEAIARYRDIVVDGQVGGDESGDAMARTAERTVALEGLRGIFCASGGSAKSNADAILKARLPGAVSMVSVNVDSRVRDLIRAGVINMAIGQRPYSIGFRLVDYLYQIARTNIDTVLKGIPANRVADTGIHPVRKDNLDNYIHMLERTQQQ